MAWLPLQKITKFPDTKMEDLKLTSIRDFQEIYVASQDPRHIYLNVQVRVTSDADYREGGRCGWQVQDISDGNFRSYLIVFHEVIPQFSEVFQRG